MSQISLPRDANRVTVIGGTSSVDGTSVVTLYADPTTHRLLVDIPGGSGTVTDVSVATANGFAGTVATATTTPVISLKTGVTGLLLGDGTGVSAATAGTDYTALAFKTISVAGQSDVVADSASDTLTLVGSGVTITTNASTDTITFTTSGTGLTVGGTSIASGTDTKVLFDNAGTLGEYTVSGSGNVAMTTSPSFTTPTLGVASATTINKVTFTAPATGSTLTIADGKTLTVSNTLTFTGTDTSSVAFGAGGTVLYANQSITLSGDVTGSGTTAITTTVAKIAGTTVSGTTGSTNVVFSTSPSLTTPVLGVASATSINKLTLTTPATGATLTIIDGKTLTVNKSLTLDGTDSTTMTFPSTTATIARIDAAQTFTGTQTFSQVIQTANAITATSNAATVPVTSGHNIVTNNSAATLTITLTTASAVNMQTVIVQILDSSAAAQTITWVNTEDSTVTAPTTSNGSTSLPLTVGFIYNSATSHWRCIAKA